MRQILIEFFQNQMPPVRESYQKYAEKCVDDFLAKRQKDGILRTYDDIIQVINSENIDRFLKDFEMTLRSAIEMKEMLVSTNLTAEGLEWIDDGKSNVHLEIEPQRTQLQKNTLMPCFVFFKDRQGMERIGMAEKPIDEEWFSIWHNSKKQDVCKYEDAIICPYQGRC